MRREIRDRWTSALRSGEYTQTQYCLHDSKGFCVNGVLADLYAKEHNEQWVASYLDQTHGVVYKLEDENANTAELGRSVLDWAGVKSDRIAINGSAIWLFNDTREMSFNELADLIEEHIPITEGSERGSNLEPDARTPELIF